MELDKNNAITLEYSLIHFGLIGFLFFLASLGVCVILLRIALYAYITFQGVLAGSMIVIVPLIVVLMLGMLLLGCIYALNAMLNIIKIKRIYLSNEGIWLEFFRYQHSYVLKWSDINKITQDGNAICVYYYFGHRYFYHLQDYESNASQRAENKTAYHLKKIRFSANLRGYDAKQLMSLLQTFEIGGCSTTTRL